MLSIYRIPCKNEAFHRWTWFCKMISKFLISNSFERSLQNSRSCKPSQVYNIHGYVKPQLALTTKNTYFNYKNSQLCIYIYSRIIVARNLLAADREHIIAAHAGAHGLSPAPARTSCLSRTAVARKKGCYIRSAADNTTIAKVALQARDVYG